MHKLTEEFLNDIKNGVSYDENTKSFSDDYEKIRLLDKLIDDSNITKKEIVAIITPSDNNGYKYLNGGRKMQRDILLKICIACSQNIEDTSYILKRFGFLELYPRIKREYIIMQGIISNFTIESINKELAKASENLL